jgi:hypothetical protein
MCGNMSEDKLEKVKKLILQDIGKLHADNVEEIVSDMISRNARKIIGLGGDIRRTRIYREILKEVKKRIYYTQRVFIKNGEQVTLKDRGEHVTELIRLIENIIREYDVKILSDIGCGYFPLTLPMWKIKPEIYYAIDNKEEVLQVLRQKIDQTIETKVYVLNLDITKTPLANVYREKGLEKPQLSLYNSILHTLTRTRKTKLPWIIENDPSKLLFVSEPRISLVKKEDITLREKRFLERLARILLNQGIIASYKMMQTKTDIIALLLK